MLGKKSEERITFLKETIMNWIIFALSLSFLTPFAFAEKKNIKIKGVHCSGCIEMIEGEVCESQKFKTCKVHLLKDQKNMGEIELETKDGEPIDMAKLKEKVHEAGDDYKVLE